MTDLIAIALISAIPGTIAAIASVISASKVHKVEKGVNKVEKGVNGLQDKLVKTTRDQAFAEGVKHEQDNPEYK